jgi:hypothetical protein
MRKAHLVVSCDLGVVVGGDPTVETFYDIAIGVHDGLADSALRRCLLYWKSTVAINSPAMSTEGLPSPEALSFGRLKLIFN